MPRAWLVALMLLIVGASAPAWLGTYIYDDWSMRDSPLMDGLDDLLAVFSRTSNDYFELTADQSVGGSTYRPLSHLSLIAVQATSGSPLVHHLVGLALHLTMVWLLFCVLRRRTSEGRALVLSAGFGLHPLGIEAYGWINGRSDLLAGLALVAIAWLVSRDRSLPRLCVVAVCAAAGVLSKETAAIAVGGLLVSQLFPESGMASMSRIATQGPYFAAGVAGMAAALAIRGVMVGFSHVGVAAVAAENELVHKLPVLLARVLEQVLVPVPRTMATLAWDLAQPLDSAKLALLGLLLLAVVWLLVRRHLQALVLLLTAVATVLPTVTVSSSFWSGLDRYLYMPLMLVGFALSVWPSFHDEARVELGVRTRAAAFGLACLLLAVSTYATAKNYSNQPAFMASLIRLRPEDPAGYLLGAAWMNYAGHRDDAIALIDKVPRRGLPRPYASVLVQRLVRFGKYDAAIDVFEDMSRRYPSDPYALYDVVAVSLERGAIESAFSTAEHLRDYPGFCEGVRVMLDRAAPRLSPPQRARVAQFREAYACR